jgi:hypothetical protein
MTRYVDRLKHDSDEPGADEWIDEPYSALEKANILSSEMETSPNHRPVLDIDMPITVLESSTPGHHHLLIDRPMHWSNLVKLLDVMGEIGILERGYVDACKARGYTAVRLPWIRKESDNGY